jgi:hypothetical protein
MIMLCMKFNKASVTILELGIMQCRVGASARDVDDQMRLTRAVLLSLNASVERIKLELDRRRAE